MPVSSYPVLYSFRRCPYAMRARLALAVSGQTCELREVALGHKPAELLQASPKGTVPVWIGVNGEVIEESLGIMLWALKDHDPLNWLPGGEAMAPAMQWITRCDAEFKPQLDRYKYPNRFGLSDGCGARDQAALFLNELNQRLACQPSLTGTTWGLVDAAIAPFVRQFAHTHPAWFASQPWHLLQAWLAAFEASSLFASIMGKYPTWAPGDIKTLLFK